MALVFPNAGAAAAVDPLPNAGVALPAPNAGVEPAPNAGAGVPPNGVPELAAPNAGGAAPCCWFWEPNGVLAAVPKLGTDVEVVVGAGLPNTGEGFAEEALEPNPWNTEFVVVLVAVWMQESKVWLVFHRQGPKFG